MLECLTRYIATELLDCFHFLEMSCCTWLYTNICTTEPSGQKVLRAKFSPSFLFSTYSEVVIFSFGSTGLSQKGLHTCTVMTQVNCTVTEIMHESLRMRPRKGHRLPHYLFAIFCFCALPFFILRKCF